MENATDAPVIAQAPVVTTESNTKTVIGFKALSLATPDNIKSIFKLITFVLWMVALGATTFLSADLQTKETVLAVTGYITLVLQKAEDFWGVQIN